MNDTAKLLRRDHEEVHWTSSTVRMRDEGYLEGNSASKQRVLVKRVRYYSYRLLKSKPSC